MGLSLYEYCVQGNNPQLLSQWNEARNGNLTPPDISYRSQQCVWWRCEKGHEWQTRVEHRTNGHGCPYCSNQKVLAGYNDLATTNSNLVKEWHPTLNGELAPEMVTAGSRKKVWWQCSDGHVWKTAVYSRADRRKKHGCPVCNRKLSLSRMLRYKNMVMDDKFRGENTERNKRL